MRLPLKGSKCFEEAGQFKQALSLLIKHNLFEAAIDCLHRYQILVQVNIEYEVITCSISCILFLLLKSNELMIIFITF